MFSTPPSRSFGLARALAVALLAAGAVGLGACGRHAAFATQGPDAAAVAAPSAPSVASVAAQALPAAPVPATFDVASLAEQVRPMVVNITTTHDVDVHGGLEGMDPFDFFGRRGGPPRELHQRQTALGTGFIIDPSGYVVTNNHVVDGADEVRVRLADEREFPADVIGRDPRLDVALLKVKGATGLPAAELGSSDKLRVGEYVLAVGNPFGLGHTVTLGIVSAKARSIGAGPYDDFIQTDASINPGNSGGPLFNWRGQVIGINTAIRAGANGIGFAIPIDAVKDVIPALREKGRVERGKLGLAFQPLTSELAKALHLDSARGALVADVAAGGSAARAGIRSGDVILAVNGTPIVHAEELPRNVAKNPPGKAIKVTIQHGAAQREVLATLDALADEAGDARPSSSHVEKQPATKLGLQVSDVPGGGVRVEALAEGSSMQDVDVGDVILEVSGAPIANVEALRAAMAKLKPGTTALLRVRRGKLVRFAAVPIPLS